MLPTAALRATARSGRPATPCPYVARFTCPPRWGMPVAPLLSLCTSSPLPAAHVCMCGAEQMQAERRRQRSHVSRECAHPFAPTHVHAHPPTPTPTPSARSFRRGLRPLGRPRPLCSRGPAQANEATSQRHVAAAYITAHAPAPPAAPAALASASVAPTVAIRNVGSARPPSPGCKNAIVSPRIATCGLPLLPLSVRPVARRGLASGRMRPGRECQRLCTAKTIAGAAPPAAALPSAVEDRTTATPASQSAAIATTRSWPRQRTASPESTSSWVAVPLGQAVATAWPVMASSEIAVTWPEVACRADTGAHAAQSQVMRRPARSPLETTTPRRRAAASRCIACAPGQSGAGTGSTGWASTGPPSGRSSA